MDKFEPNTELYGRRIAVYLVDDVVGQGQIIKGHLDRIIDSNTFVVDGRTFYTNQSDNFDPTQKPMALYLAIKVLPKPVTTAELIEPHAASMRGCESASIEVVLLTSAAISLKRIADAFDGTTLGVDITESLAGMTLELLRHRP